MEPPLTPENLTVVFKMPDHSIQDTGFCERNLNLLAHAQAIELEIGSRCGGHGVCGGDRIKVTHQVELSQLTEVEKKHFTPEEIAQGWRLACQCFPEKSNQLIVLSVPPKI
jgi:ferredoxin